MKSATPLAALAGAVLVAGMVAGVVLEQTHRDEAGRERVINIKLVDAGLAERVRDLQSWIDRVEQLAADSHYDLGAGGLGELLRTSPISAVGTLGEVAGRLVPGTGGSAPGPGSPASVALTTPGALVAAERARDLGAPGSVLVGDPKDPQLVVFWPRYSASSPPATTIERRALSTGWLIGLVRPESAIAAPLAAARDIGLAPRLVLAVPVNADLMPNAGGVATDGNPIAAGLAWHLDFPPAATGISRAPWVAVGLGCLGALAVLWVGGVSARRQRVIARGYADVTAQVRMLGDLGASLQESLDLGAVLPGVLSRLATELGLDHIGVAMRDGSGHFEELFALGNAASSVVSDWLPPGSGPGSAGNDRAPAGALTAIPLRRELRTIGRLTFVASRELDQSAQAALASTADLIAGAVGNAVLYEREQQNVRQLRALDALKDSFLATVSHELRTPLTVLTGFTNLLNDRWDQLAEHDRRDAVARMQTHTRWLTSLVNDILDFITDRRDSSPILLTQIDLGAAVGRHLDELSPLLADHRLTAMLEPGVFVQTDATALARIVANLLSNAVKFAPPGSEIAVGVSRQDRWGLVALSDHGPGISAQDQEHIFERFYRGKSDAAQTTRGVGIGLAVVADWVAQIGGEIAVESEVGAGTTIILRLPVLEHSTTQLATHASRERPE